MATRSARRFDLVEGALALVFVMMLSFGMGLRFGTVQFPAIGFVHPQDRLAGEALARRFGPTHHSGGPEEWIVRDTFQDERGGVFADIGAWQPVTGSNTYYLEHVLGWTGLAVDALPNHAAEWRRERPRSQFGKA